ATPRRHWRNSVLSPRSVPGFQSGRDRRSMTIIEYAALQQRSKAFLIDSGEKSLALLKREKAPTDQETEAALAPRLKAQALDASVPPLFQEHVILSTLRDRLKFANAEFLSMYESREKFGDHITAGQKTARLGDLLARAIDLTRQVRQHEDESED